MRQPGAACPRILWASVGTVSLVGPVAYTSGQRCFAFSLPSHLLWRARSLFFIVIPSLGHVYSLQLGRFLCGVVFSEEMAIAVDIPNVFLRPPRCNGRKKAVGQIAHSKAGTKLKRRQILTHCVIKYC